MQPVPKTVAALEACKAVTGAYRERLVHCIQQKVLLAVILEANLASWTLLLPYTLQLADTDAAAEPACHSDAGWSRRKSKTFINVL
jgi:hypothetical protein